MLGNTDLNTECHGSCDLPTSVHCELRPVLHHCSSSSQISWESYAGACLRRRSSRSGWTSPGKSSATRRRLSSCRGSQVYGVSFRVACSLTELKGELIKLSSALVPLRERDTDADPWRPHPVTQSKFSRVTGAWIFLVGHC